MTGIILTAAALLIAYKVQAARLTRKAAKIEADEAAALKAARDRMVMIADESTAATKARIARSR